MKHTDKSGFSLIELLIVVAIILIIAAIAIPNLVKSKMSANESSAVGSLHTLNTALVSYNSDYSVGYPPALSDLGPSSLPSSAAADLIDGVLVTGTKSGYIFTYTPGPIVGNGQITTYSVTASPITQGVTGQRGFFTDQTFVIRVNLSGTAGSTDQPL
jgi:type IV pilus assembly protein PilA